ncbi:MAG TPA: hypothetical protein VIJ94_03830, partial [Caulobacteraceae bacterium]
VRVLTDPRRPPQTRQVAIGINNNVSAQVLSGLKAGDKVIIGEGPAKPAAAAAAQQAGARPQPGQVRAQLGAS